MNNEPNKPIGIIGHNMQMRKLGSDLLIDGGATANFYYGPEAA